MTNENFESSEDVEPFDDEDDAPTSWEILEAKYGRELTEEEVRLEVKAGYEEEFLDLELYAKDFEDDVARYQDWLEFKAEQAQKSAALERVWVLQQREADEALKIAEDLSYAYCSPVLDEDGSMSEENFALWKDSVNQIIKERLDFFSLLKYANMVRKDAAKHAAIIKADKRHEENRAMKAEVFAWLDENLSSFPSMDKAAEAIAAKVVPIAFRTARKWIDDYKKLRSAGTE